MGLFNFTKKLATKAWSEPETGDKQWYVLNQASNFMQGDDYENVYGNVTALTKSASVIEPFLKDAEGERFNGDHNIYDTLYRPNTDMDDRMFREALFLLYLMKPKFYVQLHYKGARRVNGTIPADKITGYTFLEGATEQRSPDGTVTYRKGSKTYYEHEVMTFFGLNPNNLMGGYSPMKAVRRWTRIQDFMSDMQAAHFRNGAVPAGMFIINANTEQQFLDIKRMMQKKFRGAKNSNNVIYNWRQPDPNGGTSTQDQVVWVPYNITNKDLALKDLNEIIDKKQNEALGVSAVIKGNVDETTYASATTVEKFFVKYTLLPLVTAVWRRFSHELARVTGGFDYSIGFELEIPVLGDELIQRAEAKKTDAETIILLAKQYTLPSIVEAFDYPESYGKLKPIDKPAATTPIPNTPTTIEEGEMGGDNPEQIAAKALSDESRKSAETALRGKIEQFNDGRIGEILEAYFKGDQSDESLEAAVKALEDILSTNNYALMESYGSSEQSRAVAVAGSAMREGVSTYRVGAAAREQYRQYLSKVAAGYNENLRSRVHAELEKQIAAGAKPEVIKGKLMELGVGKYEANRLAVSEVNRAANVASLDAYRRVDATMLDHYFVKIWKTKSSNPCPLCLAMVGTERPLDTPFLELNQHVNGEDHEDYQNTFVSMQTADAHPHCECYEDYEKRRY